MRKFFYESRIRKSHRQDKNSSSSVYPETTTARITKRRTVLQEIAKIIAGDVGITALVLRTINSSFFNLRSKVYSIEHAINLLGIQYTINIVSGLLLRRTIEESEGANPTNYRDSPANVAMVAANITRSIGYGDPDKMHVIALFHNAGHALFSYRFTDAYSGPT